MNLTFHGTKLANGMRIFAHQYPRCQMVQTGLMFHSGSKNDPPRGSGYAHFCEHLMFTGTPSYPDFDALMSAHGGSNNAWTDYDATCFVNTAPPDAINLLLELEADRVFHIPTSLNAEKFEIEKDVVRNELREQYESSPYGSLMLDLSPAMFGHDHPYGHPVIGNHDDIESASYESIRSFLKTWYTPSNATLVIIGDIDPYSVIEKAKTLFLEIGESSYPDLTVPEPRTQPVRTELKKDAIASYEYLGMEWLVPPQNDDRLKSFSLLSDILCAPRTGLLYKQVELEKKLATSIESDLQSQLFNSFFSISSTPNTNQERQKVIDCVFEQLTKIANCQIPDKLVEQAKKRHKLNWLLGLEDVSCRLDILLNWLQNHDSLDAIWSKVRSYEKLNTKNIANAAQWLLNNRPLMIHGRAL